MIKMSIIIYLNKNYHRTKIVIMNENIIRYLSVVLYTSILFILFYYIVISQVIGKRYRDVGLIQYNGEKDKMVPKDTLEVNEWELYYIQHGIMKGY